MHSLRLLYAAALAMTFRLCHCESRMREVKQSFAFNSKLNEVKSRPAGLRSLHPAAATLHNVP